MAAMRGMDVTILRSEGFELSDLVMDKARRAAATSGGSVVETHERSAAMQGCHVIYVNSWGSSRHYGNKCTEEKFKRELRNWRVDEAWFDSAAHDCRFMHCLPVRRGVTVTDDILDGPRSVVIAEARNRMLVQMAVLHQMLSGS